MWDLADVGSVRCTTFRDHHGAGALVDHDARRREIAAIYDREFADLATPDRNVIAVEVVNKYSAPQASGETNVVDLINEGRIDIVVNTPSGGMARADGYEIRAAAVAGDKALFTTMAVLGAAVSAFPVLREGFEVKSLQDYAIERAERA